MRTVEQSSESVILQKWPNGYTSFNEDLMTVYAINAMRKLRVLNIHVMFRWPTDMLRKILFCHKNNLVELSVSVKGRVISNLLNEVEQSNIRRLTVRTPNKCGRELMRIMALLTKKQLSSFQLFAPPSSDDTFEFLETLLSPPDLEANFRLVNVHIHQTSVDFSRTSEWHRVATITDRNVRTIERAARYAIDATATAECEEDMLAKRCFSVVWDHPDLLELLGGRQSLIDNALKKVRVQDVVQQLRMFGVIKDTLHCAVLNWDCLAKVLS